MNPKIAIEVFGELRLWKNNNFSKLVNFFNSKGFEVDILGTFYNDKYTKKQDLSCFTKIQLIDRIDSDRYTLESYFYSLSKSYEQRIQFQTETSTKYQFIVACRPDIVINLSRSIDKDFDKLIKNIKPLSGAWFCHQSPQNIDVNNNWVNDQIFICNDKTLEIFTKHYYKNKDNKGQLHDIAFRYHYALGHIIQSKKIKIIKYKDGLRLSPVLTRHKIMLSYNIPLSDEEKIRKEIKDIQEEDKLHKLIVDILK